MPKTLVKCCLILSAASPASDQETITYEYDALGRLTRSNTAGGLNDQVQTRIVYDAAGNRMNYEVENAPAGQGAGNTPQKRFIVLPLNGFIVIPIN